MSNFQAVFMDRDGTIGGTGHFIHPRDFTLYEGAKEAIAELKEAGLKVLAFTNQHRISRGQATIEDFQLQFRDIGFDDSFICPHGSSEICDCRKPRPGMLYAAADKYGLDLTKCVVVGDVGDTDMLAAHAVGCIKILVKTGWGKGSLEEFRNAWKEAQPDFIANDITEAAKWIIERSRL